MIEEVLIQKSIDLSATNENFVKKYELESNFLTPPTEGLKCNDWVNTQLYKLVF